MRKLSDTMIEALSHVATYGQFHAADRTATRTALVARDAVAYSEYRSHVQVTAEGWAALPANTRQSILIDAWDDAYDIVDVYAPFDAGNAVADDVADQAHAAATSTASEPTPEPAPATPAVHHGPKHRFSHLMAQCYCGELIFSDGTATMKHAAEMAATALRPMTSVVTSDGLTGRVLSQDTGPVPVVRVRMHASNGTPDVVEFARGDLRTAGDLWAELDEIVSGPHNGARPFRVRAFAFAANEIRNLAQWLQWSDVIMDESTSDYYVWQSDKGTPVRFAMLSSYGDYDSSGTADASNYRVLNREFGERLADPLLFTVGHSTHDGVGIAIRMNDPRWNVEQLSTVVQWMHGIEDYPVISEQDLAEYESELAEQWWDGCGRSDTLSEVDSIVSTVDESYQWDTAPLRPEFATDPRDRDDILRDLIMHTWSLPVEPEIEPEGSTSIYFRNWAEMVGQAVTALYRLVRKERCPRCYRRRALLHNGTFARHANPITGRHCHGSGTSPAL